MPLLEERVSVTAPFSLADYTSRELILPRLVERDAPGIIGELCQVLQRHGCLPDVLPFYQSALNQELDSSSALECGIAIPHARIKGITRLRFAFGRVEQPVIWGVKGSLSVQLVFLVAVPASDGTAYLQLLACLARLGRRPDLIAGLREAHSSEGIYTLLRRLNETQSRE